MSSSMSALNKLFVAIVEAIDRRWRWDRFPTPVSLALILGIRDDLREHNLFDTNDAASTPTLPPEPPARVPRGALGGRVLQRPVRAGDGHGGHPVRPQRAARGTPSRRTRERLLTPNPRLVSTRCSPAGRR